jgi:hypothetical protein
MASFAKGLLASFINDLVEYGSYLGSLLYAPAVVAHALAAPDVAAHALAAPAVAAPALAAPAPDTPPTPNFFIPFQNDYSTIEVKVQAANAQDGITYPQKVVQIGFHPTLPILHTYHENPFYLRNVKFISGYSFGHGPPRRIIRKTGKDINTYEDDKYVIERFAYSGKYSEGVFLAIIYIKKGTELRILRIFRVDDEGNPTFVKETNLYDQKIRDVDHLSFSPLFPVLLLQDSREVILHDLFSKDEFIRVSVPSNYTSPRNSREHYRVYIAFHPRLPIFAVSNISGKDNIDIFNYSYNSAGSVEVNFRYYLDLDPSISHTIQDITFHPDPDNIILAGIYTNTTVAPYWTNQPKIQLFNLSAITVDDSSRKVDITPFDTIIPESTPDSINFHSHIPFMSVLYQRSIRLFYVPGYVPGTKQLPHMELTIPELYKEINDDLNPMAVLFHPSLPYFAFAVKGKITIITFPVPNIPKESFQRHYGALARALSQKLATNPNPDDRKFHQRFMRSIVNRIVSTGGMTEDMIKMVKYYNPDLLQSDRLGRSTLVNPVLGRHEQPTVPKLNTGPDYFNGELMEKLDGGSKTRRKSKSKTTKKRRHSSIKKLRRRAKARTRTRTRTRK